MSFANPQFVLAVNVPPNDYGVASGRVYTLAGRWACPRCGAKAVLLQEFPSGPANGSAWECLVCRSILRAGDWPADHEPFRSKFFVPLNDPDADVSDVGGREPVYVTRGAR